MAIPIIFMLLIVFAIGAGEHVVGGDLTQAQDKLRAWFGVPAVIISASAMLAIFFAQLNIMAKRIRHMGLSGWWWVLGIVVINFVVTAVAGEQVGNILGLLIALALLFIPGGIFGRSSLQ